MVKCAVLGVGSIGQHHARVYTELPDVELVAVADPNSDAAKRISHKYHVPAYSDYRELLAAHQPEAVTVAVPTAMHEMVATDVMKAGAHVLVEKPIAASVEEGQRLIATAQELERLLMIGHIVRFNPAIQALKEKLKAGDLGRVFQIVCRRIGPFPARIRDVGVVIDLAPHDIDIMRFLTDEEPIRIYAETERRIHTDHEDMVLGLLQFESGIKGSLEINWLTPTKVREIVVLGERGMFRVDDLTQDLYYFENAAANGELWNTISTLKGVSEGQMIRYPIKRQEPLKAELNAFVSAVQSGGPAPVTGEDGLAALRLSQALVESGIKHQVIAV